MPLIDAESLREQGDRGASGLDGRPGLDGKLGSPGPSGQRVCDLTTTINTKAA